MYSSEPAHSRLAHYVKTMASMEMEYSARYFSTYSASNKTGSSE